MSPSHDRREEHGVRRVASPPKISAGLARYFRKAVERIDHLEYGDPREYLSKSISDVPTTPLSEIWVAPKLRKFDDRDEITLGDFLEDEKVCRVVLADPGFGKSTLARFLTCHFINAYERGDSPRFGVYVPLSQLRTKALNHHDAVALAAAAYVGLDSDQEVLRAIAQELPRSIIIFDGLDELPTMHRSVAETSSSSRVDAQELIATFRHQHAFGGTEIIDPIPSIVTCRQADYFEIGSKPIPAPIYVMSQFTPPQRDEVINKWHSAALKAAADRSPTPEVLARELAERAKAILSTLREHADLGELCLTPLMLSILQTVYAGNWDLPASVSQLCSRAVEWMLVTKQPGPDPSPLAPSYSSWLRDVITELAWRLHGRLTLNKPRGFPSEELRSVVYQVATISKQQRGVYRGVYEDTVTSVCTFLERGHGILVKLSSDQFDFAHNMLREVMAGRALGNLDPPARRHFALEEAWAGPIRYWAGLVAAENRGDYEISLTIDELEHDVQAGSIIATVARAEMLVEVCLVKQGAVLPQRLQQQITTVTEELTQALSRPDLPRATRVRIGDLLSVLGDPTQFIAWPATIEWIPAGQWEIGTNTKPPTKSPKYAECLPVPVITGQMAGFGIGRYLVTNREYERFIAAGGYQDERYWRSRTAWAWANEKAGVRDDLLTRACESAAIHYSRELASERVAVDEIPALCQQTIARSVPLYWTDPSLNRPNQPVVGVNWWEAQAYCAWLTHRLRQEGNISETQVARLPLETEWEVAARLCGDGVYPWTEGEPFECAHLGASDSGEPQLMRSCAVGLFRSTPSRLPIFDLVGNVWEWTASRKGPYTNAIFSASIEAESMEDRIARGSSCLSREPEAAKVTFRSFDPPYNAYDDLGFRVVIASDGA